MDNYDQYGYGSSRVPAGCTLKDYRKNYASDPLKKSIRTWSIVAYVLVGINVLVALLGNILALVDVAILLGLTLGVHLGKSKGCAVGLLVYAILTGIIGLLTSGSVNGWMWIIVSVCYLGTFKKIDEEYKAEMARNTANTYTEIY